MSRSEPCIAALQSLPSATDSAEVWFFTDPAKAAAHQWEVGRVLSPQGCLNPVPVEQARLVRGAVTRQGLPERANRGESLTGSSLSSNSKSVLGPRTGSPSTIHVVSS